VVPVEFDEKVLACCFRVHVVMTIQVLDQLAADPFGVCRRDGLAQLHPIIRPVDALGLLGLGHRGLAATLAVDLDIGAVVPLAVVVATDLALLGLELGLLDGPVAQLEEAGLENAEVEVRAPELQSLRTLEPGTFSMT
jgi:hypothetical protein